MTHVLGFLKFLVGPMENWETCKHGTKLLLLLLSTVTVAWSSVCIEDRQSAVGSTADHAWESRHTGALFFVHTL